MIPGIITRACPLNPSVPPSTIGIMEEVTGAPYASYSEKTIHILISMIESGHYIALNLKLSYNPYVCISTNES